MRLDWDHVYLLGWFDHTGRPYLTTWDGNLPMVTVVVHGVRGHNMPLWNAPVPSGARLEVVPEGEDPQAYAVQTGGLRAIGWYIEQGVKRRG